jgi:hypothetical protein
VCGIGGVKDEVRKLLGEPLGLVLLEARH